MNMGKAIFTEKFKFTDNDGIDQELTLRALTPEYLPKLLMVAKKLGKSDKENLLENLDEDIVKDLVILCSETMKLSYPTMSEDDRNDFIGSYFLELMPVVLNVNLNKGKK